MDTFGAIAAKCRVDAADAIVARRYVDAANYHEDNAGAIAAKCHEDVAGAIEPMVYTVNFLALDAYNPPTFFIFIGLAYAK